MGFVKQNVVIEKRKAEKEKPVLGYLTKKRSYSFPGENGQVTVLELQMKDTETGKKFKTNLTGNNVDLEDSLVVGQLTRISKRAVKDETSGLEFAVTDVEQDADDVLKA